MANPPVDPELDLPVTRRDLLLLQKRLVTWIAGATVATIVLTTAILYAALTLLAPHPSGGPG